MKGLKIAIFITLLLIFGFLLAVQITACNGGLAEDPPTEQASEATAASFFAANNKTWVNVWQPSEWQADGENREEVCPVAVGNILYWTRLRTVKFLINNETLVRLQNTARPNYMFRIGVYYIEFYDVSTLKTLTFGDKEGNSRITAELNLINTFYDVSGSSGELGMEFDQATIYSLPTGEILYDGLSGEYSARTLPSEVLIAMYPSDRTKIELKYNVSGSWTGQGTALPVVSFLPGGGLGDEARFNSCTVVALAQTNAYNLVRPSAPIDYNPDTIIGYGFDYSAPSGTTQGTYTPIGSRALIAPLLPAAYNGSAVKWEWYTGYYGQPIHDAIFSDWTATDGTEIKAQGSGVATSEILANVIIPTNTTEIDVTIYATTELVTAIPATIKGGKEWANFAQENITIKNGDFVTDIEQKIGITYPRYNIAGGEVGGSQAVVIQGFKLIYYLGDDTTSQNKQIIISDTYYKQPYNTVEIPQAATPADPVVTRAEIIPIYTLLLTPNQLASGLSETAYNKGYAAGLKAGGGGSAADVGATFFGSIMEIFEIQIFPNFTLGAILSLIVGLALVSLFIKFVRG